MRKTMLALAVVALVMVAGTAMATPVTYTQTFGANTFSGTLDVVSNGGTAYTATLIMGGPAGFYTDTAAVHVVNDATNIAVILPAGWTGGIGNVSNCTTDANKYICAENSSLVALDGTTVQWTFNSATGMIDPFSIQFDIYNSNSKTQQNFVGNFSQNGPTTTPEPASLALLSAGLIGLGGLVRRRK